jgi:hypothetical protein
MIETRLAVLPLPLWRERIKGEGPYSARDSFRARLKILVNSLGGPIDYPTWRRNYLRSLPGSTESRKELIGANLWKSNSHNTEILYGP